jgi:branched-subunit amino acid ABC-type transport system permease component
LSYGLLLFMLSSGLTLIFSMMGVLNFAHASFYMLGAYFGLHLRAAVIGFWPALVLAPHAHRGSRRLVREQSSAQSSQNTAMCLNCW